MNLYKETRGSLAELKRCIPLYLLDSYDHYPSGASRDPTFGVSGWVSSGGFGNLIGGGSGFAAELAGGADGSSEFIRYYPPMQFRCGTP